MRTVRYICTFAIVCAVILVFSGCGGGDSDEELPGPPAPDQKLNNYCTSSPQPCNK